MSTLKGVSEPTVSRRGRHAEGARNDQRLLDAARDVFASQGTSATVAAIAARAGLGIGSLYRRYGGKTELLQHLCLLAMQQAVAAADEALAQTDAAAALTSYIRAYAWPCAPARSPPSPAPSKPRRKCGNSAARGAACTRSSSTVPIATATSGPTSPPSTSHG